MPTNRKFDILLNQKGYMLSRATSQTGGRAWQRTGAPDVPDKRPVETQTVGVVPPQIDYPELWNDWSGGFGYPYRAPKNNQSFYAYQENPNRYHWAENFDARWPHQLVHAQQMQLLDGRYASINCNVLNLIDIPSAIPGLGGLNAVEIITIDLGKRITPTGLTTAGSAFDTDGAALPHPYGPGRPALFGSFVYAPYSTATDGFGQWALDTTMTGNGTVTPPARGFTAAGNRLWMYQGLHTGRFVYAQSLAAGADPQVAANWSATLSLGNGVSNANDIRAYKDQVFVGLEDGLYAGDQSGTFINVLADMAGHSDPDNCRDIAIHNGSVIAQHIAGIYAYNPALTTTGQVREIGPNLLSNRSPVTGKVRVLESFGPWLYAGLWTGSQSYILAGIDENPQGPYTWHVLNRFPHVARPQRFHVDGITTSSGGVRTMPQRMWAATDPTIVTGGTAPLYVWPIPILNGDPLSAQMNFTPNYVGSARIDLGIVDSRAPATPKLYRSVTIESENLGSPNRYADVYYTIDQSPRTLLGRIIDSPRGVLYFPSATGSFSTGYGIELSLESFTTTPDTSPVYRSIILRSTFRPNSVDMITAVLDLDDAAQDRQGSPMRPGATQILELRALARQSAAVTLIDLTGNANIVEVLAPIEESEVYQASDENPVVAATVKMAVMQFSP